MGDPVGLWGGVDTLWMETPGPTLRSSYVKFSCERQLAFGLRSNDDINKVAIYRPVACLIKIVYRE